MPLRIQGTVQVPAPPVEVYPLLFDPEVWRRLIGRIPGIGLERFERVSETEYQATALISVAMIKGRYEGRVCVLEQRPPEFLRLSIQGGGGGNRAGGEATIDLRPSGSGSDLSYDGEGNVSGPLASAGQRLVDTIGRQFIEQGALALAAELAAARPGEGRPDELALPAPRANPAWLWAIAAAALLFTMMVIHLITR